MNLSDELLAQIEELAGLFLEPGEIAVLLDLNQEEFMVDFFNERSQVYLAYFKGKTISKKAIHENVVKMAKHGSPQAEELAKDFMLKQSMAEKRAKK